MDHAKDAKSRVGVVRRDGSMWIFFGKRRDYPKMKTSRETGFGRFLPYALEQFHRLHDQTGSQEWCFLARE
jgi:hypothetical protein